MKEYRTSTGALFCVLTLFGIITSLGVNSAAGATYLVPPLPADNLVQNPWFRNAQNSGPGLDAWVTDGHWGATDKDGNPTPDGVLGTCARISTGRGDDNQGQTVLPGVDTYLYQIIPADPNQRLLKFDMYWVTHTLNPGEVKIFGGPSAAGPWTELWRPFYQIYTRMIIPTNGHGQDLWPYYSGTTDLVTTSLTNGFPCYKLEVHAILPDEQGGFKITGIYFATEPDSLESLRLQNARMTATGMQMSFAAAAGKAYTVQYSEGLATANWLTLTNVPSQEASSSVSITDPGPLSRQRFYRVMSPGSL